jgi:uncharacterized protein
MEPLAPLNEKEIGRLASFLLMAPEEWSPLLSELDGFLTALAIQPEPIPKDEWLREIFGPSKEGLEDAVDPEAIVTLIVRMQQEILHALSADPPYLEPILDPDTDGTPMGEIWAEGFRRGMEMRFDVWQPLLDSKVGLTMLTPILALADDELMRQIEPRRKQQHKLRDDYAADLYFCSEALYRFARKTPLELRALDAEMAEMKRKEEEVEAGKSGVARVGRNDPCPCGSGKKFKRCCGAAG